jgi:hypothetical protein
MTRVYSKMILESEGCGQDAKIWLPRYMRDPFDCDRYGAVAASAVAEANTSSIVASDSAIPRAPPA